MAGRSPQLLKKTEKFLKHDILLRRDFISTSPSPAADAPLDVVIHAKRQQNSLQPVAKLPAEILCDIFVFCVSNAEEDEHDSHSTCWPNGYTWISVTHVCHYWRAVALKSPGLWAVIPASTTGFDFTLEILRRSQRMPLDVEINTDMQNWRLNLGIIQQEAQRIRGLVLLFEPDTPIPPLTVEELPHLRSLHARVNGNSTRELPGFLDHGQFPDLVQLNLWNIRIFMTHPIFSPRLTQLSLCGIREPDRVSVDEVLRSLHNMPLLEDIRLAYIFDSRPAMAPSRTITLSNLKALLIVDSPSPVVEIFEHIIYPPHASIQINVDITSEIFTFNAIVFGRRLAAHMQHLMHLNPLHTFVAGTIRQENCQVDKHSIMGTAFIFDGAPGSPNASGNSGKQLLSSVYTFSLALVVPHSCLKSPHVTRNLAACFAELPLTNLRSFDMERVKAWNHLEDVWIPVLRMMDKVYELAAVEDCVRHLPTILDYREEEVEEGFVTSRRPLLKNLVRLRLEETYIDKGLLSKLCYSFHDRRIGGWPLQSFSIKNCHVRDKDLETLALAMTERNGKQEVFQYQTGNGIECVIHDLGNW
ncbi:unnamed protein product [Somion occarium]